MQQLIDDLVLVFGFPRHNAHIAVNRFINGALDERHEKAIKWLLNHPFVSLNGEDGKESNPTAPFKQMDELNYIITRDLEGE